MVIRGFKFKSHLKPKEKIAWLDDKECLRVT